MWLSIRLPQLPLESLCLPAADSAASSGKTLALHQQFADPAKAQAVVENNRVICLNAFARQQGIRVGQTLTSAYALCDDIQLFARHPAQELQKLTSLATVIYHYSPNVVIDDRGLLLIEIARSLKLYQGLEKLIALLGEDLKQEQVEFQLAIGHTATSAEILSYQDLDYSLSCWQSPRQTIDTNLLSSRIAELPVELIDLSPKVIEKIRSVGLTHIGELQALPCSAIRKRFGKALSDYLLKLHGQLADPRDYFMPAETFYQKLDFIDVIQNRQGLLFPIKRLTQALCRFLTVKQKNCQCLRWELFDSDKNVIGFDVLLTESLINDKVYIELTQLNLERYSLHAPIEAIALTANKLNDLIAINQQLFEQAADFKQSTAFINKIRARLGNGSCYTLEQKAEHVPELACRQVADIKANDYAISRYQNLQPGDQVSVDQLSFDENLSVDNQTLTRPSWLLEQPQRIHFNQTKLIWQGELKIVSAQERITSYWWKKKVARDYYLAEHDDGTLYWVFYDQLRQQWFLHGVYS
jgi:protein ImuB